MSQTIEDRVHRYAADLDVAADRYERNRTATPTVSVGARTTSRPVGRAPWQLAAVASLACAALVLAFVIVVRRHDATATSSNPSTGVWMVPAPIEGVQLWYAQSLDSGLDYAERYRVLVARPDGEGGFIEPATITVGEGARLWMDQESLIDYQPTSTAVAGHAAEFVTDPNYGTILQYEIANGDVVVLRSDAAAGHYTQQRLLDLADAVVPTPTGELEIASPLPEDFQVLAAMNMHRWFGTAPLLDLLNESDRSLVEIEAESAAPDNYEFFKTMQTLRPVVVRGVEGWYTTSARHGGSPSETTASGLFWRQPSGEVVTITSNSTTPNGPLSEADLQTIANDLELVSESEWQAYASTADTVGTGVGDFAGPTQVAFPTPPVGYRLQYANLDSIGDPYGLARYVSTNDPNHDPIIDVRLHGWSPEEWDQLLAADLVGRPWVQSNGRTLIDTTLGIESTAAESQHAAAMEWITNVIVEVVVHTPDGSPLPPPYRSLDDLAALANQLNGVTFFETRE